MNCKYCGDPMTRIEGIKGMHYECSDKALGDWEELNKVVEEARQACNICAEETRTENWVLPCEEDDGFCEFAGVKKSLSKTRAKIRE